MYRKLEDMDLDGKRVLIRVDFNVPLDDNNKVEDDYRIRKTLPTIKHILSKKTKVILMSHLGRPKGGIDENIKLDNVAERLSELLGKKVKKIEGIIGIDVREELEKMQFGDIVMLENLRFDKREEANDEYFARELASYGDIYVNEAFSVCHRKHASVHAITRFIEGCAGYLLDKEITTIKEAMESPKHPFVAIVGGAKLETKIPMIEHLLDKVDKILLGGGMIFTFFKAQGFEVGKSIVDKGNIKKAKEIIEKGGDKIVFPEDIIVAKEASEKAQEKMTAMINIKPDDMGLDIGPGTIFSFQQELDKAKTIIWNGPLGMYEIKKFAEGSSQIAEYIAKLNAVKIIGGGDTADIIRDLGLEEKMTHVSTGGGASLAMFSGEELPAIAALEENYKKFN